MQDRFHRMQMMVGEEGMGILADSFAVVIGLGAVGSFAAEAMVRAGVGRMRLVDFDVVSSSNINRQLYALESTVGKKKTAVARERCLDINSGCDVEVMDCFFNDDTADDILGDVVSKWFGGAGASGGGVVIDAIDSLGPKIELARECHERGLRLVSSMGAALRWDCGAVRVGRLRKTRRCALAKDMRKRLRRRGLTNADLSQWCVWSDELMGETKYERMASLEESEKQEWGRQRRTMGSLPTLTGMFGLTCAHVGLELLLGMRED